MAATRHPVGPSSYDDGTSTSPFGKIQNVSSAFVAAQVSSLCYEFDTQFPGALERGDRLTVNEGIREKRRMEVLRAAWETYLRYGTPFAALAAALYFSTHREEIGSALDFGITTKDGSNRAMTAAEAEWVHQHGVPRGIVHTGALFNPPESWHHNGGYAYSLPPITGVNQPGEPLFTTIVTRPEGPDEMKLSVYENGTVLWLGGKSAVLKQFKTGAEVWTVAEQIALLERLDKSTVAKPERFNKLQTQVLQRIMKRVA